MNGHADTWEGLILERPTDKRGRNDMPALLWDAYVNDWLPLEQFAIGLEDAWVGCEWPGRQVLGSGCGEEWNEMFEHCGYLENTTISAYPETPPAILYRAAPEFYKTGMSWTDDLEQAKWFNDRNNGYFHIQSRIWTYRPSGTRELLAHFHDPVNSRGEHEWVLNDMEIDEERITPLGE
ncbi:hypothetical protein [Bifidobacterium avesanii]|uniref:Uncharacterized protein n=1 Tax=Bifidobacterium avesanii TaxID=1798157 RepID=A0A7K3TG20_9BIFI|nr:hypothetical protein [Bifidobacterium avesanii]KAB8294532.1 hypothetical protein DSM100685_0325 [Bifidobacterium avesanii]NEG78045.1 hypothetical protein [Bifidobacterium avesanii]